MNTKLRRQKIVYVDHSRILHLAFGLHKDAACIEVPRLCLPEGSIVESVFYAPERAAFGFIISNESFDPVPDGCVLEVITCDFETRKILARSTLTSTLEWPVSR